MANEIISYPEMCQREGVSLQRGMNSLEGRPHAWSLRTGSRPGPSARRAVGGASTFVGIDAFVAYRLL